MANRVEITITEKGTAKTYSKRVKGADKATKNLTKSALTLGLAYFGARGVINAFKSTITAAGDAQEVVSKFEAVFKDQAAASRVFAVDLATAVGRSETEMLSFLSTLQDTFVPMGFARDQAADLSEQLVTLAIDVASFNDKADADVIRDFQSALVGNTETVRKYGIVITEAGLKQEALDSGLISTARTLTEQEKIQLRLNLIMKGTTDAQGDAIRTLGSFNNRMKALNSAVKDASIAFGEGLLPAATAVAEKLTEIVRSLTILRESTDDYTFANKALKEQMELVRAEIDANEKAMKSILGRTLDLQVATEGDVIEYHELESATKDARLQLEEMEQQLFETTGNIDGQTTAISDQIKMWGKLAQKQQDQLGLLPDISDAMSETDRRVRELTRGLDDANDLTIQITRSFDSFEDSMARAIVSGGDLEGILRNLVIEMGAAIIKAAILAPLMDAITGGGGGGDGGGDLLGVGEGAAAGFAIGGPIGAFVGALAGAFFEHGGVSKGGLAVVGEGGPELVNLPRGAQVFNNQQTRNIVNQGPERITIEIDGQVLGEVLVRQAELGKNRLKFTA